MATTIIEVSETKIIDAPKNSARLIIKITLKTSKEQIINKHRVDSSAIIKKLLNFC